MERLSILVGTTGRGSNMAKLIAAARTGEIPAEPYLVLATAESSPALEIARDLGVESRVVEPGEGFGTRLCDALEGTTILCLAGFMRLLPSEVLALLPGRVLNIHPALLPRHGGTGMYGSRVHRAVLESGDRESGCSVHFVTERYDEGSVILQASCPVRDDDTPESLAARVLELEHETYPKAVRKVLLG